MTKRREHGREVKRIDRSAFRRTMRQVVLENTLEVVPGDGSLWVLRRGDGEVVGMTGTKSLAIKRAKQIARVRPTDVYVGENETRELVFSTRGRRGAATAAGQ